MNNHMRSLELDIILDRLASYAHSESVRERLKSLSPITDSALCRRALLDTRGARTLLESCGTPPLSPMDHLVHCIQHAQAGGMLQPAQLYQIARFTVGCSRMTEYLRRGEKVEDRISFYGRAFDDLTELKLKIETSVDEERILDDATSHLRKLRREMATLEDKIRQRLLQLIQNKKKCLADHYFTRRNGRFVLPVLKQFQQQITGRAIDASRSGGTVFIEPVSVANFQQELEALSFEEEQEMRCILYTLSDLVAQCSLSLVNNAKATEELDFIFAKGAYSLELNACATPPSRKAKMMLCNARNPMLDSDTCIPLNISLSEGYNGIVISGPNTGGKTVVLKTVGLLALMAQCGLHIPCDDGSLLPLYDRVYCDIGDSQSIGQKLSTFLAHMNHVIAILQDVSSDSLVLIDEIGSGTDPAVGSAIAIAVLEALRNTGCTFLVTTHYEQVKTYVNHFDGIMCARMTFDASTLLPLYRLEMDKSGSSCALEIVRRLGMPKELIVYASAIVQKGASSADAPPLQLPRKPSRLPPLKSHSLQTFPAIKWVILWKYCLKKK